MNRAKRVKEDIFVATTCSAFIDLAGTRARAVENPGDYRETLDTFREHLSVACDELPGPEGKIYFFSDSAYIQGQQPEHIFKFMQTLRYRLLGDGYYFKASIKMGSLEADTPQFRLIKGKKDHKQVSEKLIGPYFGAIVEHLFANQETLKGTGIWVDKADIPGALLRKYCIDTCFLPTFNSHRALAYKDVIFEDKEIEDSDLLQFTLRQFYKIKSKSKKQGRFFIPLMITWLNSINLATFDYRRHPQGDMISLLVTAGFQKMFCDIPGYEYVYLSFLSRVYKQRENVSKHLYYDAKKYIMGQRNILRRIDDVPLEIMPQGIKDEILNDLSSNIVQGLEEERKVTDVIKGKLQENWKIDEIAKYLNEGEYPSPTRMPWTTMAIRKLCHRWGIKVNNEEPTNAK